MFWSSGTRISLLLASSSASSMAMATISHPLLNPRASVYPGSGLPPPTSTLETFSSTATLSAGHATSSADSTISESPFLAGGPGPASPVGKDSCPVCYRVDDAYRVYAASPKIAETITQTVVPYVTEFEDGSRETSFSTLTVTHRQSTAAPANPSEGPDNFWSELNAASVTLIKDEFEYEGYTFTLSSSYSAQTSEALITYFSPIGSSCFTGVLTGGLSPVYPYPAAITEIPRDVNALIEQAQQPLAPWTSCTKTGLPSPRIGYSNFTFTEPHASKTTFTHGGSVTSAMQWAASLTQTTITPVTVTRSGPHLEPVPESGGGPVLPINGGGNNRPNGGDGQGGGNDGNGGYPVSNGSGDREYGNGESSGSDSRPDSRPHSDVDSSLLCALGDRAACADSYPAKPPPHAQTLSFPLSSGGSPDNADPRLAAATQTLTASNGAILTAVVPSGFATVLMVNGVEVSLGGPSATVDGVRVGLETSGAQAGDGEVEIGMEVVGEDGNRNGDGKGDDTVVASRGWRLRPRRGTGAGVVLLGVLFGW